MTRCSSTRDILNVSHQGASMKLRGRGSWTFGSGADPALHVALLVRDTWNLDVPQGTAVPPRLEGELPPTPETLDAGQLQQAAVEWPDWWNVLLAHTARSQQGPPNERDQLDWLQTMHAELLRLSDPPDFESLTDRPALEAAARHAFPERGHWRQHNRPDDQPQAIALPWRTIRKIAKEVAARNKVRRAALHGYATVLRVQGIWWDHIAPGAVACSANAARDPGTTQTVVAAAFESSVRIA